MKRISELVSVTPASCYGRDEPLHLPSPPCGKGDTACILKRQQPHIIKEVRACSWMGVCGGGEDHSLGAHLGAFVGHSLWTGVEVVRGISVERIWEGGDCKGWIGLTSHHQNTCVRRAILGTRFARQLFTAFFHFLCDEPVFLKPFGHNPLWYESSWLREALVPHPDALL